MPPLSTAVRLGPSKSPSARHRQLAPLLGPDATEVNGRHREILVNWLCEVASEFHLLQQASAQRQKSPEPPASGPEPPPAA